MKVHNTTATATFYNCIVLFMYYWSLYYCIIGYWCKLLGAQVLRYSGIFDKIWSKWQKVKAQIVKVLGLGVGLGAYNL